MDPEGRQLTHWFQIVIEGLVSLPALASAAEIADGHGRLGVDGEPNRVRVSSLLWKKFLISWSIEIPLAHPAGVSEPP